MAAVGGSKEAFLGRPRGLLRVLAYACFVAVAAAGCSGNGSSASERSSTAGRRPGEDKTAGADKSASSAEFEPVASASFPLSRQGGTLKLEVSAVHVDHQLATVDVRWSPTFPPGEDESLSVYDMLGKQTLEISLVDPAHLKHYLVVKDAKDNELQTEEVGESVPSGGSTITSATFAAPPPDVDTVDVYITGRPPFKGVPVRR